MYRNSFQVLPLFKLYTHTVFTHLKKCSFKSAIQMLFEMFSSTFKPNFKLQTPHNSKYYEIFKKKQAIFSFLSKIIIRKVTFNF